MKNIDKIQERLSQYCESDGHIGDLGDLLYELDVEVEKMKVDSELLDLFDMVYHNLTFGEMFKYRCDIDDYITRHDTPIREAIKKAKDIVDNETNIGNSEVKEV